MLDHPEKTARLIAALKVAVPFEINLTPEWVKHLQAENFANPVQTYRTVSDLSYAGDEGGIVCHIVPLDEQQALIISLTHIRMPRTMALATAVIDYQSSGLKPPRAAADKSRGGERCGNAGTRFRQARLREASASEPSMKCRKRIRRCQNRGLTLPPGSVRGNPEACPSGIRHVGGAKLN